MSDSTTAPATTTEDMPGVSQAALFAREHAKGAAKKMLDALDEIGRNSVRITQIALGVSMPHQISFLLGLILPTIHVGETPGAGYVARDIIHLIGMFLLVAGVPVAADLLIVNCIKVIGQPAASRSSKKAAIIIMMAPVAASVVVNVMAPAPHWILRVLAGFIVAVIPASETVRMLTRPDFAKIEAMELQVEASLIRSVENAVIDQQPVTVETPDQKALNKQRMVAAQKARGLAMTAPEISIAALMRATGCGRGAAKKAIELAHLERTDPAVLVED